MLKRYFIPHEGNEYHPHFYRNTALGVTVGLTAVLLFISVAGSKYLNSNGLLGAIYATALVDLTNQDRSSASLPTLSISETLAEAAKLKVEDMIQNGYFAHNSPDGKTPWYWIAKSGYKFAYAGENLAINFNESEEVERAWMDSPGHRANILNNTFSEVGVAVREGEYQGKNVTYVVQMFGKPAKSKLSSAPLPISEPALVAALDATSTASTSEQVPVLASIKKPPAEVKGEAIEITTENSNSAGNNLFIAAKDPIAAAEAENAVQTVETPELQKPAASTVLEKTVMRFPKALNMLYMILGIFALFGMTMLAVAPAEHRKPKLVLFGALLLILFTGALYANSSTELFALASTLN